MQVFTARLTRATLLLTVAIFAAAPLKAAVDTELQGSVVGVEGQFEAVDRIQTWGRLDDFRVIDAETVVLWATPFRPYLVKLSAPTRSLRFARAIGVTSTNGAVTRFDSVLVRGQRLPIRSIYRLEKAQARALQKAS